MTKARVASTLLFCMLMVTANASEEYSSRSFATAVASNMTWLTARSDIECAVMCTAANTSCKSYAFSSATNSCLMSEKYNADFSSFSSGGAAFRTQATTTRTSDWFRDVHQQIGDRTFRIIQQRSKGALRFNQSWVDYENGFGDDTDFWLGLQSIHNLTGSTPRLLRVEALTWSNVLYVCEYSGFTVGDAGTMYTMTLGSYLTGSSNTTQDSLMYHNGRMFSTFDKDNDGSGISCSTAWSGGGGWWYNYCSHSNPNGLYFTSAVAPINDNTMNWLGAGGSKTALKSIRIMLQV